MAEQDQLKTLRAMVLHVVAALAEINYKGLNPKAFEQRQQLKVGLQDLMKAWRTMNLSATLRGGKEGRPQG